MLKILILGSSGMLGNALLEAFTLNNKYKILAPTSKELDLTFQAGVDKYFFDHKPDLIINVGGLVRGLYGNLENNKDMYKINLAIGKNVALAVKRHGGKLLYFGSSCMYRADLLPPYKEENIFDEIDKDKQDNWGYALAKQEVAKFIIENNLGSVIVPPNLFGQRRLSDTEDINNKHLLETIAYKYALTGDVSFKCSPEIRREILSVKELARVTVKYLDLFLKESAVINVGCGRSVSMGDIAERLTSAEVSFDDKAYSSLPDKFMDTSKFEKLTGEVLRPFKDFKEYLSRPFYL
jgi:GDP-L-fucose synthase